MMSASEAASPEGPRERMKKVGLGALSNEELVALVLGTGTVREPVSLLAARLLREAGGLGAIARTGAGALERIDGIGESKASRLLAAIELGRRVHEAPWLPPPRISSSRDVDAVVRARLIASEVEHFVALALDARHRVKAEIRIATGGVTSCSVAPADAFRAVLREAAAAVVFVHNHPSGDVQPSADDVAFTRRLVLAGRLLGIAVIDHVIVGRQGYFSFLDARMLETSGDKAEGGIA